MPHELRNLNAYYTNRIEGQHTRPHEIDQALRQDFSKDATLAAKQHWWPWPPPTSAMGYTAGRVVAAARLCTQHRAR